MICSGFAEPARLELRTEGTPSPGPGEVLVAVEAAGIGFVDNLIAKGLYQVRPPLPYTPGLTAAGHVAAVGAGVTSPVVGDRVAVLLTGYGGCASHLLRPAGTVVPIPDEVSADIAATAIENYGTVLYAVTERVVIRPGTAVVVLGAGGGIGLAAVDVARALGARVVAVASTEAKRAAALAAGAHTALGYENLKNGIREATGGGADVVVDPVGGEATEQALRALAAGGTLCVIGFASGGIPRLPANVVLLRNRSVVGVDWGDWSREDEGAARELVRDMLSRIAGGEIHPPVPEPVAFADAAAAFGRIDRGEVVGKLVLRP
ncbi:zinc-binding dehydrogenase [Pseudonocardia ailaonensis]|uniref:zinc-binding dehydrogenase n=1 Tax=Pseudonocardia ailaonensis TaxID=367279 RepID=UPI0031D1A245